MWVTFKTSKIRRSMFVNSILTSRTFFPFVRNFHAGKLFHTPSSTENILLKAICVNLRQKKWSFLSQVSPNLTHSLVNRVVGEFQHSPQLALEFYNWVGLQTRALLSLECSCNVIHLMVNCKRFDDALLLIKDLMCRYGLSPLEVLDGLMSSSYDPGYRSSAGSAAFDALVRACTQMGASQGAYEVIKELEHRGLSVTIHAWNNYLNHYLKLNKLVKFWAAYKEFVSLGYVENVYTLNLVIYSLCKDCKILEALSVFYRMKKMGIFPNVVTFNMLVDGTCRAGDIDLALKLVRKMGGMSMDFVNPNILTYNSIVNGFCKFGKVEVAEELLDEMIKVGAEPNVRTYATLVDGYSRRGSIDKAFSLCDAMVKKGLLPNSVVYNTMIHSLYIEGDLDEASLLLSYMINNHITPDRFTNSILTKGLCESGSVSLAFDCQNLLENKYPEDSFSHNILIHYLCRSKNIAGAQQLLGNMYVRGLIPDTVTYGTLIDAYCKQGNISHSIQVYNDMIKEDKDPNLIIYNAMVNGLCKEGLLDSAKALAEMVATSSSIDEVTCNTLISGYLNNGKFEEASTLFLDLRKVGFLPNRVTYNTLLNHLCKFGCFDKAKEVLNTMIVQGIVPDFITYTTLITHFIKRGNKDDEVIEIHDYLVLNETIPDRQTYAAIVRSLVETH